MGTWGRCVALACAFAAARAAADASADRAEPLTEIHDVIRLPREAAALGLPVRLRAVVTAPALPQDHCFVQSGRDGIAVVSPPGDAPLRRGDLVEIVGVTTAGRFAPNVVSRRPLARLGRAPLPDPEPLHVNEFVNGSYHGRFMQVSGVVRSAELEPGRGVQVVLATGFGRMRVVLPLRDPATLAAKVGAEVTVRGAFATDVSAVGQLAGIRIHAQDPGDLDVRVPPVPFSDLPYRVLADLARYDPSAEALGRVRTRGVVTFLRADGAVFVQEGEHVAVVRAVLPAQLAVGDPVEVVGFAAVSDGMLTVDDAQLGPGPTIEAPSPRAVADPQELSSTALDGRLIRVRGEAQLATRHSAEVVITTRPTGMDGFLEVRLPLEQGRGLLETLEPGSVVECTGVKLPLVSTSLGTRWPVVLARAPADVVVVRSPPFWTLPRASAAAAGLLLLLLAGATVARWREVALRRSAAALEARVQRRTRDLAIANGNLLKLDLLRRRFIQIAAHDLRSPLAVVLSNSAHVLSLPAVSPGIRGACEDVQTAARRIQDLLTSFLSREHGPEPAFGVSRTRLDLAEVVGEIPRRLGAAAERKHQWIEVTLPPGPAWIDGDLVLVAHVVETLADNALKFSPPRTVVRASVHTSDGEARACIADQGPGLTEADLARLFVPGARLSARPTGDEPAWGLGLVLAKAWVEAMKGRIWAERAEGGGAAFWLSFPLRDAPAPEAPADRAAEG